MSDALTPLRCAYGMEPAVPPGAPGYAEQELIRGTLAALSAAPPRPPAEAVVEAVRQRAAQASAASSDELRAVRYVYGEEGTPGGAVEVALLSQTRGAVERAFAARPQPRPAPAVVEAVEARAAEGRPERVVVEDPALVPLAVAVGGAGTPSAESALLAQSLRALDRAPRRRPDTDAVDAVLAFAASASASTLDAVRYVYDDGARPEGGVEVALLEQSREVVERALRARPQPRPDASAVDAVLARAAEATALRADEPTVSDRPLAPLALAYHLPLAVDAPGGGVETALLGQSQAALDRLRPARPSGAVVANVLDRAASAARRPAPSDRPAQADRPAAAPASRRRVPAPVWVGGAALMLAALTAIAVLPGLFGRGGAVPAAPAEVAVEGPSVAPEVAAVGVSPEPAAPELNEAPAATAPPPAPTVAAAGFTPVAARLPVTPRPARVPARTATRPAPETPAWEAGEDVRALSLRLEEIDRSVDGLAWDEPAEVFGQPAVRPSAASAPGLRTVREGAPPARARIQPADSTRTPR